MQEGRVVGKVNPKVIASDRAIKVAAEIAANGGTLTAEEWEFGQHFRSIGWSPSRTSALAMAGPNGAIKGKPGDWRVYRCAASTAKTAGETR